MKIMLVHNYYINPGGEDQVFAAELKMLQEKGNNVFICTPENRQLERIPRVRAAIYTLWNTMVYRAIRQRIREVQPNVIHIHNTFPLASPAVIHAARAEGIATVQTLHNYRLICPNALFYREGKICELCKGKYIPWPSLAHACYRNSRAASAVVASMLTLHRAIGTWSRMVDVYIALTEFARNKFIEGGLPKEKIVVKPNFVYPDPGQGNGKGGYALFVGRLSPEKGVRTLIAAWEKIGAKMPLTIIGGGTMESDIATAANKMVGIEYLGRRPREQVIDLMKRAAFLIFPSEWYEGFPMTIAEAYATGLPVIASNLGSMASLIDDGRTGLHFRPGDPEDLADKVDWLLSHPVELANMRKEARAEYEAKYTAERNYRMLMEIYERAISVARSGG